ncbi:TPA: hypothetical protein DEP90_02385 [Patescibacteria group bacterium]|nr:hypothetical protein [Patescibacteria group bacterium]
MRRVKYDFKQNRSKGTKEKDNWVSKIFNSMVGRILLLGVSILMVLSVYRSIKQMVQKISLLKQAEYEVEELRIKNLELSLQIEEASSIEHLEQEARDRLNYGKGNEVVFVINDELIDLGKEKVESVLYAGSRIENVEVWSEWVDFVVEGY